MPEKPENNANQQKNDDVAAPVVGEPAVGAPAEPQPAGILPGDVQPGSGTPPQAQDVVRERRRRRQRYVFGGLAGVIVLAVVAALVIAGRTGLLSLGGAIAESPKATEPAAICPQELVDYPREFAGIYVAVLNGADKHQQAGEVAGSLHKDSMATKAGGDHALQNPNIVAAVVSGPRGRSNALAVQSMIPGSDYFSDPRKGTSVTVILGNKFEKLAAPDSVTREAAKLQCPRLTDPKYASTKDGRP